MPYIELDMTESERMLGLDYHYSKALLAVLTPNEKPTLVLGDDGEPIEEVNND